ncbi:MAG TPA: hypothetical protein ENH25_07620 [candidate division Zixibacteria bacterium]|nr:hypothetical protein [candidate division Zixibacteria bacterium]
MDIAGIDNSPLAARTCREKGLKNILEMSVTRINPRLGKFGTLSMPGNNFGLFGNLKRVHWLLRKFKGIT